MIAGFDLCECLHPLWTPLGGRATCIGFPFDPFVPVVVEGVEVQQAGRPRNITVKRQPQMKLRLQRASNTTVVCSMLEGLLKTEGDGWLQAVESRTAPRVGWRKPHVSCQAPLVT